jgi:hypothetical protein
MFVKIVLAALAADAAFRPLGLIPTGPRLFRSDILGTVAVDYKQFLPAVVIFIGFWLTRFRGATDPSRGMKVDGQKALRKDMAGETFA